MAEETRSAVLGGGCFWCTEAVFSRLQGVLKVTPGYAGGSTGKPTYEQVCSGTTGHAEVIKVDYDPSIISFTGLLDVFFHAHDPTTANRQGNDHGTQYRSIILYSDEEQKSLAERCIGELNKSTEFKEPLVTEVKPLTVFYAAEGYHHDYYENNSGQPYCRMVIKPKLDKFRQKFPGSLKQS